MTENDFDDLCARINLIVQSGVESGKYNKNEKLICEFDDEFELEFENGQVKKWPKKYIPVRKLMWTENNCHQVYKDVVAELGGNDYEGNTFILKELSEAVLTGNRSKKESLRDYIGRAERGDTLFAKAVTYLSGVGLDQDRFVFECGDVKIELRQSNFEEFQSKASSYQEKFFQLREEFEGVRCQITVPIKKLDKSEEKTLEEEVRILKWVLSLMGTGSVCSTRSDFYREDFGFYHKSSSIEPRKIPRFYFCLQKAHLKFLEKFYKKIRQGVICAGFVDGELNPVQVAYERYRDALFYENSKKQISSAIMGLEALFSRRGPELSYSLRMRANILMKLIGKIDSREHLRWAYELRSEYAHGNVDSRRIKKKIIEISGDERSFSGEIVSLLRLSILGAVLLGFGNSPREAEIFQDELDDAMSLDHEAIKRLRSREGFENFFQLANIRG